MSQEMTERPHFMMIHDIVEENGKTIRENNLARQHEIPVDSLVEIVPWDETSEEEYGGVRLFVVKHTRDCDGTPLYSLAPKKGQDNPYGVVSGFSEWSLRIVPEADRAK